MADKKPRLAPSPISTRQVSIPKDNWTLEDAVRMARQGYSLQHIEERTGWATVQVLANLSQRR